MAGKRRDLDAMKKQYDKTSNGASISFSNIFSGIGNAVGSIGNAVGGIFGGGGQSGGQDTPPSDPGPGPQNSLDQMMQMLTGMTPEERQAAREARRANRGLDGMGGDGENVVIKGKMTKGGAGGGMGFRPHFQGGFAADVPTATPAAGASFNFPKIVDHSVRKHRISKRQENVKDFFNTIRTMSDHSVPKKKSKQEEKTKRQAARQKFKLDKIKAKKK